MAAIMPRSLTPLLLLLLAATVPATLAVRPAGDAIAKKCDGGTAAIMECIDVLNRNPDGVPPRRLAELAYSYLVKDGEALYKETQAALVTTPEEYRSTVASLNFTMKFYYDSVVRFVPEESKKRFDEAKSNLDEILNRMPPPSTGTIGTLPETRDLPCAPGAQQRHENAW
jgi:hypothetical protein